MNYMDYVNDPCMFMFTEGQMQRMLKTIEKYRNGLLKSETFCANSKKNELLNCIIFPNPTEGKIKIEWALDINTEGGKIQVFNTLGQLIIQQLIPPNTGYLQLGLSNIVNGIYYLSVNINEKGTFLQKILVTK